MHNPIDFEKALNNLQLRAVKEADGYSLVLAGAGSGKTRVLVYRLVYLLQQGVAPQHILLLTFTNKASAEMLKRAAMLVGRDHRTLWGGTFHHVANKIVRREARHIGFTPDFTILDREDANDLMAVCVKQLLSEKDPAFPKPDVVSQINSFAVNAQEPIVEVIARKYDYLLQFSSAIEQISALYRQKKQQSNLMDFDDLLYYWYVALQNPHVQQKYAQQFQYILVDEHQDTNRIQFEILQRLCVAHRNLLVVGDDAQSIYSFRAADIKNILEFPNVFKGTKIFPLTINYRSTPEILAFANQSIQHNQSQFPKQLTAVNHSFQRPQVIKTHDVYQQAEWCVNEVDSLVTEGLPLHTMAVLFRSRYQVVELEMSLVKEHIPYIIRGGLRFFEQAHIKDVVAYLKVQGNPKDEISFKRIMRMHPGISHGYAEKIWQKVAGGSSYENVSATLPSRARQGFGQFLKIFHSIRQYDNPAQIIKTILDVFYRDYGKLTYENYQERIQELEELVHVAEQFETLKSFLADLSAYENFKGEKAIDPAHPQEVLVLSTIHQAKGLEWDTVFIIGCAQGSFPGPKAIEEEAIEEERRLFYVAVTRAKKRLYISYPVLRYTSAGGMLFSRPSLFLDELPSHLYTHTDCAEDHSAVQY